MNVKSDKVKTRRGRGFTLVELTVVMAVSMIAVTMALTLVNTVFKCARRTEVSTSIVSETNACRVFIQKWFYDNDIEGYEYSATQPSGTTVSGCECTLISDNTQISSVLFTNEGQLILRNQSDFTFQMEYVDSVTFAYSNNCLSVTIKYTTSRPDTVFFFARRAVVVA